MIIFRFSPRADRDVVKPVPPLNPLDEGSLTYAILLEIKVPRKVICKKSLILLQRHKSLKG